MPSSLMDQVRAKEAASRVAAEPPPEADPAVAAEIERLVEEERAEARARAAGGVAPPDEPAPRAVAEPMPPGVALPGPCPVGGEVREMTAEDAARRSFPCVCGETVRVKPQEMPDKTWRAKVPEHGGPQVEKEKKVKKAEPRAEKPAPSADALPAAGGVRLFVDCRPDGEVVQRLETYALAKALELAAHAGIADVRLAGGDSPLGFGKWKGHLAALVRESPPEPGCYEVSAQSELGMLALDELVAAGLARATRH